MLQFERVAITSKSALAGIKLERTKLVYGRLRRFPRQHADPLATDGSTAQLRISSKPMDTRHLPVKARLKNSFIDPATKPLQIDSRRAAIRAIASSECCQRAIRGKWHLGMPTST